MRARILFCSILIVSSFTIQDATAQSFWKKLGKGLEKVGKEVDKVLQAELEAQRMDSLSAASSLSADAEDETITAVKPQRIKSTANKNEWNVLGLQGRVKSVVYSSGRQINFRLDGFFYKYVHRPDYVQTRTFLGSKSFREDSEYGNDTWNIFVTPDSLAYTTVEGIDITHSFDDYGRIREIDEVSYSPSSRKFFYLSDDDTFPAKETISSGWEEGGSDITYLYEYIATDDKGNWTKRKVTVSEISYEYAYVNDKEVRKDTKSQPRTYIETATIVYY